MNIRTLILVAVLLVAATVGVVALDRTSPDTAHPAEMSSFTSSAAHASTKPRPAPSGPIRVAGLMINAPVHTGKDSASDDAFGVELAFMGSFERTRLALELEYEQGGVLGIDDDASALATFRDDRGTDLIKKDDPFGPFEMMSRISEDGRHLVFVIPSADVPAPSASRLVAEGTLGIRVATHSETFTTDEIEFAAGSEFSIGGFDFKVTDVGESDWGDGHEIALQTNRDTVAIVRYALVLPDGTEAALEPSMSFSGMGSWQQSLRADVLPERGKLAIEVWQDLSTKKIPFDIEAGLGLR